MKEDFAKLIEKAKNKQIIAPKQKVKAVAKSVNENEKLFTFHIDKDRLKKLKMKSINENKSIKDLINLAIKNAYNI